MSNNRVAVIVRAYAGVFFGYTEGPVKAGPTISLTGARQIYYWDSEGLQQNANTCGDIALFGVGAGSRLSQPSTVHLDQVSAVFEATAKCVDRVNGQAWGLCDE